MLNGVNLVVARESIGLDMEALCLRARGGNKEQHMILILTVVKNKTNS